MEENSLNLNYLAIFISTIATFFLSFLWYSVLFKNAWAAEMKMDMNAKPPANLMIRGLIMSFIGMFLLSFVFANNNAAWSFVPGMDVMSTPAKIANAAFFTWLGFFLPGDLSRVAWEGNSWKLFFINTSYNLATLIVAASILMYMA
jgi:hypothetical protein